MTLLLSIIVSAYILFNGYPSLAGAIGILALGMACIYIDLKRAC